MLRKREDFIELFLAKQFYLLASKNRLATAPTKPLITIKIASLTAPVTRTMAISITTRPESATIKTSIAQTNRSLGATLRVRLRFRLRVVSWALAKGISSTEIHLRVNQMRMKSLSRLIMPTMSAKSPLKNCSWAIRSVKNLLLLLIAPYKT